MREREESNFLTNFSLSMDLYLHVIEFTIRSAQLNIKCGEFYGNNVIFRGLYEVLTVFVILITWKRQGAVPFISRIDMNVTFCKEEKQRALMTTTIETGRKVSSFLNKLITFICSEPVYKL